MKIDGFDSFIALGKENAEAMVKSSNAAMKGFEELSKAWQGIFARSAEKTDAAIKAMTSVKSPVELVDLQGKLARESIEGAIADGRKIAEVSQSVFTAALEPLNARVAAFQAMAKTAA